MFKKIIYKEKTCVLLLGMLFFVILYRWHGYLMPHLPLDLTDQANAIRTALGMFDYKLAKLYVSWISLLSKFAG